MQESVADHQEALQSLLTLIQDLDSSGVLEILHALLNSKEKVASIALKQILKPSVLNHDKKHYDRDGDRHKIDPEQLDMLMEALISGLHQGQKRLESNKRVSMFNLAKALRDPGVNRALAFMLGLLQGMGQKL